MNTDYLGGTENHGKGIFRRFILSMHSEMRYEGKVEYQSGVAGEKRHSREVTGRGNSRWLCQWREDGRFRFRTWGVVLGLQTCTAGKYSMKKVEQNAVARWQSPASSLRDPTFTLRAMKWGCRQRWSVEESQ